MKKRIVMIALFLLIGINTSAIAETAYGKVTYIGTQGLVEEDGHTEFQMRFRIKGTCRFDNTNKSRWFHLRSGDVTYTPNVDNFQHIYETLKEAFLNKRRVQVDGYYLSCSDSGPFDASRIWAAMY